MLPNFIYNATLLEVVDGDTIKVDIDMGFATHRFEKVRLAHVDAPEIKTAAGKTSKAWLVDVLPKNFVVKTYKWDDKYGRYLAEVYVGDMCINDAMVSAKMAVPYEGGAR